MAQAGQGVVAAVTVAARQSKRLIGEHGESGSERPRSIARLASYAIVSKSSASSPTNARQMRSMGDRAPLSTNRPLTALA